jgi:speckle-type POZ protein
VYYPSANSVVANIELAQERSEGVIKLQDEDPDNVKRMIDYMYGLEYDVQDHTKVKSEEGATESAGKSDSNEEPINHGVVHAQVYAMGDKYLIPALKDYSKECFRRSLSTQTGNDLANSIAEAYSNTVESDRGLRDVSIEAAVIRLGRLTSDKAFSALALHIPCFGYELLQRAVTKLQAGKMLLTTFPGCFDCRVSVGTRPVYCQHMRIASVSVNF